MKKRNFKSLAILGITSGLCVISSLQGQNILGEEIEAVEGEDPIETGEDSMPGPEFDPNSENEGYYIMSEDELLLQLNLKGRKLYDKLSPEGKELALKAASRRCNGANECKGLNACKTDDNDCAGKGMCKGKTKCAFGDKNLAVKLVKKKMAEKREATQQYKWIK
ncbi:MAG: hypothetical protein K940chlam3_01751 [Chlamydiae bacterium]|nr:hypothetical protein [Chlamydiota bacterium]